MLTCNEQYSCVGPIELLCTINRPPDDIFNLLQSTITPTHDAMLYYNEKWNIPCQGRFLDYSFTWTNPIRFDIPLGCSMDKLKDIIKQVAPLRVPLYIIHESQVVGWLFFWPPDHAKYSKKLIEHEIIELKNDEDVLKVLVESNYWKWFCPIEILVIFNKLVTQMEEDMSHAQHLSDYH